MVALSAKILIVEDDKTSAQLFRMILEQEHHTVLISYDGQNITELVSKNHFDIILLDIILPDTNGFDILQSLQSSEMTKDIPVIMITCLSSAKDVKKALDYGALDYIRKPCEPIEIIARIHSALRLKFKQDLLTDLARKDALTHLYNRRHFNLAIEQIITNKDQYQNGIALIIFDCDHFKKLNDRYGHMMGDEMLAAVSNALIKSVKRADIACRFGGEELSLILPDTTLVQAYKIAERIRKNVEKISFIYKEEKVMVTISGGVSHTKAFDNKSSLRLIGESDIALYSAKKNGRNRNEIYVKAMNQSDAAAINS